MINFGHVLFFSFVSILAVLFVFFIRVEQRLTRLETHIAVIEKRLPQCQPNLDESTK